jgi:hypothetical protein
VHEAIHTTQRMEMIGSRVNNYNTARSRRPTQKRPGLLAHTVNTDGAANICLYADSFDAFDCTRPARSTVAPRRAAPSSRSTTTHIMLHSHSTLCRPYLGRLVQRQDEGDVRGDGTRDYELLTPGGVLHASDPEVVFCGGFERATPLTT